MDGTIADLDAKVAAATQAGKPVMLDFYADWCVSGKEMVKYTLTGAGVQVTTVAEAPVLFVAGEEPQVPPRKTDA